MTAEPRPVILHVDDDEANRYAVKRILEKAGFDVLESPTGYSGLIEAKRSLPDLIVLDIKLPDIDGFEVCRKIKADPEMNSIPVLQTSASFVKSEHKVTGLESGADGYLAQPIEAGVLVATVKSLLRIRKAEKLANDAMRSRDEVLAIVSHDLRNPLSFIMLQSKVMERGLQEGKLTIDEAVHRMKRINNSCLKMNRLIQDLLDVSSMDVGDLKLIKNYFKISSLLNDVKTYYEEIALQSEISLIIEANNLQDQEIMGDKERLQQVLGNLVSNSLKFTLSGGAVTLSVEKIKSDYIFRVKDTGSGISSKDLPNVFNRYWQGHPERKSGYGIGLSIVKGITEAHNGNVTIESEEGKGTVVTLRIPEA